LRFDSCHGRESFVDAADASTMIADKLPALISPSGGELATATPFYFVMKRVELRL